MIQSEFSDYLRKLGKSENTIQTYCHDIEQFFRWCRDSFDEEPQQLYRANVLDYISYMRNVRGYHAKTVNNHLSSLRSLNEYLIGTGRQTETVVLDSDFMKIQIQYASPCTVEQKDVEAFRQRLLVGGNKRDYAIVTLYTYTAAVIDYDEPVWRKHFVFTTEELLEKMQELTGRRIGVTFMDDRHVTHPPVRRKGTPTDYSTLPEYYVLRSEQGYFIKRSSRHVWFTRRQKPRDSQVRKFKTETAARKYLDDNQKSLARFAFEVECIQNGGATA